jgi:hypothetical protein
MADATDNGVALKRLGIAVDEPSDLSFEQASDWVIWQFPVPRRGWLCGAAHPPQADFGWLPIMINPGQKVIRVHPTAAFPTPEAAANWMAGR